MVIQMSNWVNTEKTNKQTNKQTPFCAFFIMWLNIQNFMNIASYAPLWDVPGGSGKKSACQCRWKRHGFDCWVKKIPWNRKWQPILVFLPVKFYGQKSLAGYSLWASKSGTWLSKYASPVWSWVTWIKLFFILPLRGNLLTVAARLKCMLTV